MKKLLLAFLAVVCFTCLGIAAAACTNAHYYTLYFSTVDGANIVCEIPSGYEVRSGYKVNFQVKLDDDAEGEPLVAVNGDQLRSDSDGNYSFTMKQDTIVSVSNVYVSGRYAVIFDKGDSEGNDYRITYNAEYVDENEVLTEINTEDPNGTRVKLGTEVVFSIDVSVYYGENPEFEVLANTQVLEPTDGKYHATIDGRVTISIQGLELEDSFIALEDGGNGTVSNPYKIRKPVDLYSMAYFMSSSFSHSQVYRAYYSLEADIDMKGEELFIIGPAEEYAFSGNFNGNGHTISNYTILPTVVDQNDFTDGFMPFIGLFGYAADAQIYDLNIKNFTCDVNAAPWDTVENAEDYVGFFIGGVVAYGLGVNITNCSVSGTVLATGGNSLTGYIGGIIGFQASAYDGTSYYYSAVRSCSTDVNIVGRAGNIYTAGGISGLVLPYGENAPAMVINSYANGNIEGAMRTGGIAGTVYSYGSVINCYATGYVDAINRLSNAGYGNNRYASSGGIVGDLGTDAIIANSFFTGDVTATASAGVAYNKAGDIAGNIGIGGANGGEYIHSESGLIYNCADNVDNDYIQNTLGWSTADWIFTNGGYPTVNGEEASNSFTLIISLKNGEVDGKNTVEYQIVDEYYPMVSWYLGEVIDEFMTADGGERSFGYYFDEELTLKVPNSYIPMHGITLYAAFADYSEVAGVYYLNSDGNGKYIELTENGELIYRDGALSSVSYYYYDGETITLRDTFIAIGNGHSNSYESFKATVEDGVMTIWDNQYYLKDSTTSSPVLATKKIENFGYGKYYSADGSVEYQFNTDGTGVYTNGANKQNFTYTVNGNSLETSLGLSGVISGGAVTSMNGASLRAFDKFEGTWELASSAHKEYTFNGKGGWVYEYYGYDQDGNKDTVETHSGSYTVSGNTVNLGNGTTFTLNSNGYLVTNGSVYYYKQYSYTGVWTDLANTFSIEITFNGVTVDGYGSATINYGANYGSYDLEYDVRIRDLTLATGEDENGETIYTTFYTDVPVIFMYNEDVLIAALTYLEDSRTLFGGVYQLSSGEMEIKTFYLYDEFRGDWISGDLDVIFNGLGNYNVAGSANFLGASGVVTVTTADGTERGTYTIINNTLSGEFSYGGNTYTISYDENSGTIKIDNAGTLQQRDEWYTVKLVDDNGNVYSFNGKGNISGAGVMTITDKDGNVISTPSYNSSTITRSGNDFKYGSTTLYVYNGFTGVWYVAGTFGGQLEIGKFNATYTATGTSFGEACTFTYHPDGNYVTFIEPAGGMTYYINLLDGGDITELAVSTVNNTFGEYSVCTNVDFDSYKGDYEYNGGTLTLDGFANSVFTDGAAMYVKDEELVETFTYVIDELGQVLMHSDYTGLYYIFYADEEGEYVKDGVNYVKVLPDDLYRINATDEDNVVFSFNGNGKGVTSDNKTFTYSIDDIDDTLGQYTLIITVDGNTETYVLDYSIDFNDINYTLSVKTEDDKEEAN
ncbi:MAG: hypothetical protein K2H30_05995 [Clostridia bacterium]|nr:hypothetical protein [Clostridia bacterium]